MSLMSFIFLASNNHRSVLRDTEENQEAVRLGVKLYRRGADIGFRCVSLSELIVSGEVAVIVDEVPRIPC
jgi:hypothetical protein